MVASGRLPLGSLAEGIGNCSLGFININRFPAYQAGQPAEIKLHAGTGVNNDCPYFLMR